MPAVGAVLALATACSAGQGEPGGEAGGGATSNPAPSPDSGHQQESARSVVLVSVDGLNPRALRGRVPGFSRLMAEGAWTPNARTTVEQTHTLPNHASMLTGRRVLGEGGTRVTFNSDRGGTLEEVSGAYVAGIFDVAHDNGLSTAFLGEKSKLEFLTRSWDGTNGAEDTTGRNDGRDKIDVEAIAAAEVLVPELRRLLGGESPPELTFLHVSAPDASGHTHGFMSTPYLQAVQEAGTEIEAVLQEISSDPMLRRRTTVVVTADHGGRGPNHDDVSSVQNYQVPFFVWGSGVRPGGDLYVLNPQRRDPGEGRPGYDGPQPIRNLDAAGLVLDLLGLPRPETPSLTAPPPLKLR